MGTIGRPNASCWAAVGGKCRPSRSNRAPRATCRIGRSTQSRSSAVHSGSQPFAHAPVSSTSTAHGVQHAQQPKPSRKSRWHRHLSMRRRLSVHRQRRHAAPAGAQGSPTRDAGAPAAMKPAISDGMAKSDAASAPLTLRVLARVLRGAPEALQRAPVKRGQIQCRESRRGRTVRTLRRRPPRVLRLSLPRGERTVGM